MILLTLSILALAYILQGMHLIFLPIALGGLILFQVFELTRFVSRTNKELARFIFSLRHADYTARYPEADMGSGFKELSEAFQLVSDRMREKKLENESYLHFLNTVVSQIRVGIIGLSPSGEIMIMNQSATSLLDLPNLKKWERFEKKSPDFSAAAKLMKDGDRILLSLDTSTGKRQLSLSLKVIKLLGEKHRIFTFYDIKSDLERKEIDSYNKLISILTHEIMNSVTPVSSLTQTVSSLLHTDKNEVVSKEDLSQEDLKDVADSVETIRKRSKGMLSFIKDYRKIAKIPEPVLNEVGVKDFLDQVVRLMKTEITNSGLSIRINVSPPPLKIFMDQALIEQVLINLIINAIHAMEGQEEGLIEIHAGLQEGYKVIKVIDQGKGVSEEIQDKIFVPFFSTKKTGSGIGLSLSQQIMQKHKGVIDLETKEGRGTTFLLKFRY